jgi:hypothetical protein
VTAGAPSEEADYSPLFAPPPRWGYEYVEPPEPAQSPERDHPPIREEVRLIPRAQAAGLWEATALAAAGGVGAIILDAELGVLSAGGVKGTLAGIAAVAVHILAAIIAFRAAGAWLRSSPARHTSWSASAAGRYGIPSVNAVGAFLVPYVVLPVEAVAGWRRIRQERGDMVPHPGEAKRAEAEYQRSVSAWQERIVQAESADLRRFASAPVWYPAALTESDGMTCIFGGTSVSWTAALTTLGASLLGSGARLVVGDLTRRVTADVLCNVARAGGVPTTEAVLPRDVAATGLFEGMSWEDLSTVLVEVLHSAQRDIDISRQERQADRSVIREVAQCLDGSAAVSIARLRQALLVVQGSEVSGNGVIAAGERRRLVVLFGEAQRRHGGVMERVTRIERALRDFDALDGAAPGSTRGTSQPTGTGGLGAAGRAPEASEHRSGLQVIGVDKQTDELENDRFADLLFQLLLRRVRLGNTGADVLVILGADRIRREALESLMTHAEQESTSVVLFFEHLRRDAIEMVGTGGAAAAFLVLGNHREAREASEFIGSEYKWIESQHTASASRSLTQTSGRQESASSARGLGLAGSLSGPSLNATLEHAKAEGRSYSEAFGQSMEYAGTVERVREAVIATELLMSLPATGMIRVAVLPGSRRRPVSIDCHPEIALSPRVARAAGAASTLA